MDLKSNKFILKARSKPLLEVVQEMELYLGNETLLIDENMSFGKKSPIDCSILSWVAIIFFVLFIFGLLQNIYILIAFYLNKKLRTFYHYLIISLCLLNFIGLLINYPIIIITKLKCAWVFNEIGCNLNSFSVLFIASVTIILMACISYQRLISLDTRSKQNQEKFTKFKLIIGLSVLVCFILSTVPMLGISKYKLDGTLTSCSLDWLDNKSIQTSIYIVFLILFVFIIPLIIIIITNYMTVRKIRTMRNRLVNINQKLLIDRRILMERRAIFNLMLLVSGYIISWFPYAIFAYLIYFDFITRMNPMFDLVISSIAKLSFIWTSSFYLFTNKNLRFSFQKSTT